MAHTIIPDYTRREARDLTLTEVIADLQALFASAYADLDVCTDPDDGHYYAGLVDAYGAALHYLTIAPEGADIGTDGNPLA